MSQPTRVVLPAGFDMEEAAAMFKEIDRDGSGECSYEEFEFWCVARCVVCACVYTPF